MPIIPIESARIGMKLDKDIYSAKGVKLAVRGIVLTGKMIQMLIKNEIRIVEVDYAGDAGADTVESQRHAKVPQAEKQVLAQVLHGIPMFEKLSSEQIVLLMDNAKIEKHNPRTILFREGDPGDTFFVVLKGSIKIYINSIKGGDRILSVCKPGDSFGELSLLDGKPRSASAQTLQKTELLVIKQDNFMNLLENHFEITQSIMSELIGRIFDTNQDIQDLIRFDARTRVIKSLIKLANTFGRRMPNAIDVDLPLDLEELAQVVGINLWELHDVLTMLERLELVQVHANHFTLNLQKLRSNR